MESKGFVRIKSLSRFLPSFQKSSISYSTSILVWHMKICMFLRVENLRLQILSGLLQRINKSCLKCNHANKKMLSKFFFGFSSIQNLFCIVNISMYQVKVIYFKVEKRLHVYTQIFIQPPVDFILKLLKKLETARATPLAQSGQNFMEPDWVCMFPAYYTYYIQHIVYIYRKFKWKEVAPLAALI